jgi:6-phosphogluconolactonase
MTDTIRIFPDLEAVSLAAAEMFAALAEQAVSSNGRFALALSGGRTPLRLYEILANAPFHDRIRWSSVHVFWGDERCVPASDLRNNAAKARRVLLDHVPVPSQQVHAIQSDLPSVQAAAQYEEELRNFFDGRPPVLDLILLGFGDNGHTASLFPHTPALRESKRWVSDVYLADQEMYRVTLTAPLINQANQVVFLVSGADKATALHNALEGPYQPEVYPAQLIQPKTSSPVWLLDKAAAQKLAGDYPTEVTR